MGFKWKGCSRLAASRSLLLDSLCICEMKSSRKGLSSFAMKKWSGGIVIVVVAVILVFSYNLMMGNKPQKKQSAYDFFTTHQESESQRQANNAPPKLEAEKLVVKPRPVNVEGLDYLYAAHNLSAEESTVLNSWANMRLLLSRSDALPETAQGIKEAARAWKDLLSAIKHDKEKNRNDQNCPYSVSMVNPSRSRSRRILDFPCGLVEDSSISLVGIPDGKGGSFHIELVGSPSAEESKVPIVWHSKVSLPGDNMTEEPFIVQNTWTEENGWGKEERCPAHASSSSRTVDGLVLCNEQVLRSNAKENANLSLSAAVSNVSDGSSHATGSFPFSEGSPFIVTLRIGTDGFHMTVNGRHETSFGYREKLDPWSASGVGVAGNLEILSALANGLPVSEDHDLTVDLDLLKASPVTKQKLVMLVGVFSTGNNFARRMALRRSWMQYEAVRSGDVAVRFFIGLHKSSQVNLELWKEAQAYGDIQLMPFVDYYSLISLKTVAICIMGTKVLPAKYVMKTDDDAFVRIDQVVDSLEGQASRGLLYGRMSFDSSPHRDKASKWYISEKEWPHDSYPPWAHGPGYIMSQDLAKFIVRGHGRGELKLFKLEDVALGIWIHQYKKSGRQVNYVNDPRFNNAGCESNYILAHYQSPRLVLCLWDNLRNRQKPICCE